MIPHCGEVCICLFGKAHDFFLLVLATFIFLKVLKKVLQRPSPLHCEAETCQFFRVIINLCSFCALRMNKANLNVYRGCLPLEDFFYMFCRWCSLIILFFFHLLPMTMWVSRRNGRRRTKSNYLRCVFTTCDVFGKSLITGCFVAITVVHYLFFLTSTVLIKKSQITNIRMKQTWKNSTTTHQQKKVMCLTKEANTHLSNEVSSEVGH